MKIIELVTLTLLASTANGQALRVLLEPDLPIYEDGDEVRVYVKLENISDAPVEGWFPIAEQPETIPSDWFQVYRNGEQLHYMIDPRRHARMIGPTILKPGESLTLIIPASIFCKLPSSPYGLYEARVTDYLPETTGSERVYFRIDRMKSGLTPSERLAGAGWKALVSGTLTDADRANLLQVWSNVESRRGLRERAVRVLASRAELPRDLALLEEMLANSDPVLQIAALEAANLGGNPAALIEEAMRALSHRDLGVRRAATTALGRTPLPDGLRMEIARTADGATDAWLKRHLKAVLNQ
jgi:hypothetical protein